jgi:hypothetical protein
MILNYLQRFDLRLYVETPFFILFQCRLGSKGLEPKILNSEDKEQVAMKMEKGEITTVTLRK